MEYITTSCRHCGYRTRNHESGVPSVQIGPPILKCPKCGHLILDSIQTEYEFMTKTEREQFSTQSALPKSYIGNILFIFVGLVLLIGGISVGGDYLIAGIICGIGCIALGLFQIIHNHIIANKQLIEQAIYESLQRTTNKQYVDFIKNAYDANGIQRNYLPLENKTAFMKPYHIFKTRQTYQDNMEAFNQLLILMDNESVEQNNSSAFINH